MALVSVTQLTGVSSHNRKVAGWIPSQAGHVPRLWVRFSVWACTGSNQLMLFSCISVSLSLKKAMKNMVSGEDKKEKIS